MDKKKLVFPEKETLKYFYEWQPQQEIIHQRTWLPETIIAKTNSDGLISNRDYELSKSPTTFRIIAIGDSFTEGPFVKYEDTYPKQLENMLNREMKCPNIKSFEVLNFGVGGYDIQYASHRYLTKGIKYDHDLVLWFLKDDDFFEVTDKVNSITEQYISTMSAEVKNDLTKFEYFSLIDDVLLTDSISLRDKIYNATRKKLWSDLPMDTFRQIQTKAVLDVYQSTKQLIIFTFKNTKDDYKNLMNHWDQTQSNIFFLEIQNIDKPKLTFLPNDAHPNKNGYTLIATELYSHIEKYLSSCKQSVQ